MENSKFSNCIEHSLHRHIAFVKALAEIDIIFAEEKEYGKLKIFDFQSFLSAAFINN